MDLRPDRPRTTEKLAHAARAWPGHHRLKLFRVSTTKKHKESHIDKHRLIYESIRLQCMVNALRNRFDVLINLAGLSKLNVDSMLWIIFKIPKCSQAILAIRRHN